MALFEYNGTTKELPKYTASIAKKMDEIDFAKSVSRERTYKAEYPFVVEVLGKDTARALLDGDSLDTADVCELDIVYCSISDAFNLRAKDGKIPAGQTIIQNDNSINPIFNQPMQAPDEIARALRLSARHGLQGART